MNIKQIILALIACILWGSAFAGAKIGFEFMPPILLSGMRFMLAGLLLLPFLRFKKIDIIASIKRDWAFMSLFAFVQTFLQYGLFYMGLDKVPGAAASIIIGAGPLFIMLMAHFTISNDKLTLNKILALALALSGVLFISLTKGGQSGLDSELFYSGVGLLLLSNLVGSYTNIMVAKHKGDTSPILLTAYANFSGGVLLLLTGVFVETMPEVASLPLEFYLSLLWLALIPAVAFSLWYTLLQKPGVKVSDLNMWKFVIPVTGCVLSWLLLPGESPNVYSLVGILVIVLSLRVYRKREV